MLKYNPNSIKMWIKTEWKQISNSHFASNWTQEAYEILTLRHRTWTWDILPNLEFDGSSIKKRQINTWRSVFAAGQWHDCVLKRASLLKNKTKAYKLWKWKIWSNVNEILFCMDDGWINGSIPRWMNGWWISGWWIDSLKVDGWFSFQMV